MKSDYEQGYDTCMNHETAIRNELKARIAELEAEQRWIPVSDGLPSGYPCLVVLKNGNIKMDFTFIDGGNYYWWNSGQDNVTHWMPLPEPPEVHE